MFSPSLGPASFLEHASAKNRNWYGQLLCQLLENATWKTIGPCSFLYIDMRQQMQDRPCTNGNKRKLPEVWSSYKLVRQRCRQCIFSPESLRKKVCLCFCFEMPLTIFCTEGRMDDVFARLFRSSRFNTHHNLSDFESLLIRSLSLSRYFACASLRTLAQLSCPKTYESVPSEAAFFWMPFAQWSSSHGCD